MADLNAKTACAGLLPLYVGTQSLTEVDPGPMTAIAPYQGRTQALADLLAPLGLGWPVPGRTILAGAARIAWFDHDHALLSGIAPPAALTGQAALTDQSDAWAVVALQGPEALAVLARLTPLDLRPALFDIGHIARSELFHMACAITRSGPERYEVMVYRSMAGTLVHDLKIAMQGVHARTTA